MKSWESFIFYFGFSTDEEEEEFSCLKMSLHRWTDHDHLDKL